MILFFLIIMVLLIILWILLINNRKHTLDTILEEAGYTNINNDTPNNNFPDNINKLNSCQVPNLSTDQCYKSRFFECPIVNGSYLQCTNNYIPKPEQYNADCGNRTFEMVPYPWKISENCYYNKIGFDREKKYGKVKFI